MTTGSTIWDQVLARIETKVNRHSFYTWFKPTSFVGDDGGTVRVRVPNALFRDWLTKHYSGVLAEALAEVDRRAPHGRLRDRRRAETAAAPAPAGGRRTPPNLQSTPGDADAQPGRPRARATPSTPSSSGRRTSSRTRPAARSPKRRRARTTRCSSTAAWDSARRT